MYNLFVQLLQRTVRFLVVLLVAIPWLVFFVMAHINLAGPVYLFTERGRGEFRLSLGEVWDWVTGTLTTKDLLASRNRITRGILLYGLGLSGALILLAGVLVTIAKRS